MEKIIQIGLIAIAGASVGFADYFIKKAAVNTNSLFEALKNPYILIAVLLYLLQIVLFSYVFVKKWDLGIVGILQMIIYSAIVIITGTLFFHERISLLQGVGIGFALVGAILMNL